MAILVIDDDELIRDSLSLFFGVEGHRVVAVASAEEGLKALDGNAFDTIIVDFRLPGMDGLEFFEGIPRIHPGILRILITACRSRDVVSRALRAGVHGLIDKPLTAARLREALGSCSLAKRDSGRSR